MNRLELIITTTDCPFPRKQNHFCLFFLNSVSHKQKIIENEMVTSLEVKFSANQFQTINFGKERQMNMIMDDGGELTATTMKNTRNIWEGIRGISEETATGK